MLRLQLTLWRSVACMRAQRQQRRYLQASSTVTFRNGQRWLSDGNTSVPVPPKSSISSSPAQISPSVQPSSTEPRLSLTFTCTVSSCNGTRSSHNFTKRAYERGVVLVECPGCRNRHLIADHLGWFKDSTADGKNPTIEDMLRAKGENVIRGRLDGAGGVIEYID